MVTPNWLLIKSRDEVRHEDLISYHHAAIKLANTFEGFYISHVFRLYNARANALAVFVATLTLPVDTSYCLMIVTRHLFCPKYNLEVSEVHTASANFESRD